MKKRYNIQYLLALMFTLALVGCSNDDFLTTQSDETNVVSFSIGTSMEEVVSKASTDYRAWKTGDPTSFGAFGMYNMDITSASQDKLFGNQEVTRSGSAWTYTPPKYWADFSWCDTFDFFGYMPYKDGATLEQGTGDDQYKYTLSFPASLPNSVLADVVNVPLICNEPVRKDKIGEKINFKMDQVLAGFNITFQLDDKMAALRDFVITQVEITGAAESLPVSGNVSRTYTYTPATRKWSAGDIVWSGIGTNAEAVDYVVPFVDHGKGTASDAYEVTDETHGTLRIGHSFPGAKSQWGADFFAIPSANFQPTIKVPYYVDDPKNLINPEPGDTDPITTRESLTAEIQLSTSFFENYSQGVTGQKNGINVFIKPAYLYVLSDYDQWIKHIVVQD